MSKVIFISNIHSPSTGGGVFTSSIIDLFSKHSSVDIHYCVNKKYGILRRLIYTLIGYFFIGLPLKVAYYFNPNLIGMIKNVSENDDLIVVDHLEASWILRYLNTKKLCFISHNDEAYLFKQRFLLKENAIINRIFNFFIIKEAKRLEFFQKNIVSQVDFVISISNEKFMSHAKKSLVSPPNFFYEPYWNNCSDNFLSRKSNKLKICFLGNISWWPNIKGLDWFIANVFPNISDKCELYLFGKGFEKSETIEKYNSISGIHCKGFVENLNSVWSEADLLIVPIFDGSGVNVKLAEIIYNRLPVIASSFSLIPLLGSVDSRPGVWVADKIEEWIDKINIIYHMENIPLVECKLSNKFSSIYQEKFFNEFIREVL